MNATLEYLMSLTPEQMKGPSQGGTNEARVRAEISISPARELF